MTRHLLSVPVLLFCLVGCAAAPQPRLPELTGAADGQGKEICAAVFPEGKWQFAHAIDFAMKDGSGTPVIGVTSLTGSDIDCALITVEGLTLFEAVFHHDGSIEVRRAVPPFDGPDFAKGMISDIRAIFQPPTGSMRIGQAAGKTPVCRYVGGDGSVVDVLPAAGDCWQIKSYTAKGTMDRSIVGRSCQKIGSSLIPDYLELKTFSQTGYTLKMTLLTADNFK
jgi:hypothetical protein